MGALLTPPCLNRTKLGLKLIIEKPRQRRGYSLNRTKLGLKLVIQQNIS